MKVLDPGHLYELDNYMPTGKPTKLKMVMQFVKKVGGNFPGNELPEFLGTNCQEPIRVIIDRVKYVNNQKPHPLNTEIIYALRSALENFEVRAAELKGVSFVVEGNIEDMEPCPSCGHVFPHQH